MKVRILRPQLVFEGRTLNPLRHILASASRAFWPSYGVRSKGAWSSTARGPCFQEGFETTRCRSSLGWSRITSKPEGRVYKAICEPRIMRSRFALYKLRSTSGDSNRRPLTFYVSPPHDRCHVSGHPEARLRPSHRDRVAPNGWYKRAGLMVSAPGTFHLPGAD